MKKYFIHNEKGQDGPYSIEDLKLKGITGKTMVWFDGIESWKEAESVPELKEVLLKTPPPFIKSNQNKDNTYTAKKDINSTNNIQHNKSQKLYKWTVNILAIIGLFSIVIYLTNEMPQENQNVGNPIDSIVVINPTGTAYYSNFNNKWDLSIKGELLNKSSITSYKDFVVEVEFLSSTNTLLTTKQFTIYNVIKPLSKDNFYARLDGDAPEGSSRLKWKLVDAIPIESTK